MKSPVYYSRRGGAQVGFRNGTWPFGKIEISDGSVTVSVLGGFCTLTVAQALRVEPLGAFGSRGGAGVRIFFRGQHWEEHVDFYTTFHRDQVITALKRAGFNVLEQQTS